MTPDLVMVACGCSQYPTKAETVRRPAENSKVEKSIVEGIHIQQLVQYPSVNEKTAQEVVKHSVDKTNKKESD